MLEITKKGGFVFTISLEIAVVEDHEHRRRRHSTLTSCHGLGRKPEIDFDAEVTGRGLSERWRTMAYLCSMNNKQADQAYRTTTIGIRHNVCLAFACVSALTSSWITVLHFVGCRLFTHATSLLPSMAGAASRYDVSLSAALCTDFVSLVTMSPMYFPTRALLSIATWKMFHNVHTYSRN